MLFVPITTNTYLEDKSAMATWMFVAVALTLIAAAGRLAAGTARDSVSDVIVSLSMSATTRNS